MNRFDPTPYKQKALEILSQMTTAEKLGQLNLEDPKENTVFQNYTKGDPVPSDSMIAKIRSGSIGGMLMCGTEECRTAQKIAVEESRLGIPLLMGYDVIHGHHTVFPIPLGQAASFNMELIEESESYAAKEAYADGINWIYAPMIDICRDPRWGRVAEGAGEDTLLGSCIAAARVRGLQSINPATGKPWVAACFKHFCGYGLSLAGRDYDECDISERTLFSDYMKPYQAAIDAGAMSVMSSYNALNGEPVSGSRYYMTDVLRGKFGFKGFATSDYKSVSDLTNHRVCSDRRSTAYRSLMAGVDMDMASRAYIEDLEALMADDEALRAAVDESVVRMLCVKLAMGLFENPYNDDSLAHLVLSQEIRQKARAMAHEAMVLLKNSDHTLPLKPTQKVFLTGPYVQYDSELRGTWAMYEAGTTASIKKAFTDEGCEFIHINGCERESNSREHFQEALDAAKDCDVIVYICGERSDWSGENHARMDIDLPEIQNIYLRQLATVGKPIVSVVLAGRALCIPTVESLSDAILLAWHPGTEGAHAITDILYGRICPSGKLPITFPRKTGQIPIFHSTLSSGKPVIKHNRYLEDPDSPLYPFGYGLSYADIKYSDIHVEKDKFSPGEDITLHLTLTNNSDVDAKETVIVFFRDVVSTYSTPERKHCGFEKVQVNAHSSTQVTVTIPQERLTMMTPDLKEIVEPGEFILFVNDVEVPFTIE